MFDSIRRFLSPPIFEDEEQTRIAGLLHAFALALLVACTLAMISSLLFGYGVIAWVVVIGMLGPGGALYLAHQRRLTFASLFLLLSLLVLLDMLLYMTDGSRDVALLVYPAALIVAAMLLNRRLFVVYALLVILSVLGIVYGELRGWIVNRFSAHTSWIDLVYFFVILSVTAIGAARLADNVARNIARARAAQRALAENNRELRCINDELTREVAARRDVEMALRESEAHARMVADLISDYVFKLNVNSDGEATMVWVSENFSAITGRTLDEARTPELWTGIFHPDDLGKAMSFMQTLIKTGQVGGIECRTSVLGGQSRWVYIFAHPDWDPEQQRTVAILGAVTDITERKYAEEALQESVDKYRQLFESESDAIFLIENKTGQILEANTAAGAMYGYSREELLRKKNSDLSAEPEETQHVTRDTPVVADDVIFIPQRLHRKKNGTVFPVEITGRFFNWHDQAVHIAAIRDITARKRTDRLLRAFNRGALALAQALTTEQVFEVVTREFRQLGASCMVFPLDESRSRLLTQYIGYDAEALQVVEELVNVNHEDFSIPVDTADVFKDVIWKKKTIFVETVTDSLWQMLPEPIRDFAPQMLGGQMPSKAIGAPLIVANEVMGLLVIQSDDLTPADLPAITAFAHQVAASWRKVQLLQDLEHSLEELQQTQGQLLQSQKMEAIGRLAAGIAHDFRNLLTTIVLYAQMPLRKKRDAHELSPDVVKALQTILDESHRAADLVQQILDFSRRTMLQLRPLDLRSFTHDVLDVLKRTIPENIQITMKAGTADYSVLADPTHIQQVLVNLALNARDAMPDGGELRFTLSRVILAPNTPAPVADMPHGQWICLSIADTGTGMTEDVRAHLFEPYFTTKPPGKGTGLGLAQVYGTVRQHEGYLGVETAVGRGTTFHIYLPVYAGPTDEETGDEGASYSPAGRGEIILLVEDNELLRQAGQSFLESLGYRVVTAANGRAALDIYRTEERVDLIISDIVMPEIGGKALLQALKAITPDVKVLGITGYAAEDVNGELQRAGFVGVIHKPFDIDTMAQVVRRALDTEV